METSQIQKPAHRRGLLGSPMSSAWLFLPGPLVVATVVLVDLLMKAGCWLVSWFD